MAAYDVKFKSSKSGETWGCRVNAVSPRHAISKAGKILFTFDNSIPELEEQGWNYSTTLVEPTNLVSDPLFKASDILLTKVKKGKV